MVYIYNGTAMITQHFLSYLFNNWEKTLGDEFFLLPLHRGGVVDLHLKYSMKSMMEVGRRTPAQKHPSTFFCCFVLHLLAARSPNSGLRALDLKIASFLVVTTMREKKMKR